MKLAEALLLRAEYMQKLDNLSQRILTNLKVQEGSAPHEPPNLLLQELDCLNKALAQLVKKINRTNAHVALTSGQTLSEALVDRDMLRKKRGYLCAIISAASEKDYRLTHTELKMNVVLDISLLQKELDHINRDYRQLDTLIQGVNWTTDLAEE